MPARMLGLLVLVLALVDGSSAVRASDVQTFSDSLQRQNLIAGYHFTSGTVEMNKAGLHRLRWIVINGPADRCVVFVEPATDPRVTTQRIAAVKSAISQLNPALPVPVYQSTRTSPMARAVGAAGNATREADRLPKPTPPAISN